MENETLNDYLHPLFHCIFTRLYHVLELICISFADERNQYNIHSQCMFRIIDPDGKTLICDNDYYSDETGFDVKVNEINDNFILLKVKNVKVDPSTGDIEIQLEGDYSIQFIVNSTDEEDEMWRFIKCDDKTPHLVCYPGHIDEEGYDE